MKIICSIWFTGFGIFGCIGIVLGEDEITGQRKAYIGNGLNLGELLDEQRIVATGSKLPVDMVERIAAWLNKRNAADQAGQEQGGNS